MNVSASATESAALAGLRVHAVANGPIYGLLAGLSTLAGVSLLAEALGHPTGMEVTMMAIVVAGAGGLVGAVAGIGGMVRGRTSERLRRALATIWRWQLGSLPAIVIGLTACQLAMKPVVP